MNLAFCLYKYFPYGGLQRDFLRIAQACVARGHAVRVYTLGWEGEQPDELDIEIVPARGLTNPARYRMFTELVQRDLAVRPVDRVVGFNKMPWLDVYYAADPCYAEKAAARRGRLYRLSGRYRHFSAYEHAVFDPESATEILMISSVQQPLFERHYGTSKTRFHLLPPGIAPDRRAPPDAAEIRAAFRRKFDLADDERLIVQIGSGFRTKGLDRSLKALAALPDELRARTRLIVIGQDDPRPFRVQAKALRILDRVAFLAGRDDIPRFLLGADVLIHPAYAENTGTVLLEAVVAGLPVLTTAVCGYAHYVEEAGAGRVLAEPFEQSTLDAALADMLMDDTARAAMSRSGLTWAERADIYSLPERAADVILGDHR
ncbi:glycosyltransferase family 4 protein [Pseudazoarcus pumilus]|uniref:Glucosyltransferase I RfaG n=1 Tax=Pseudazoarcus pumilus TaxID=2067960 RepID=A0A2I6S8V9_9RHOO|nr:glycosyltransferase family 4 protein [Pseudazoarcus pumilus]AUN95682.1 glucosyltransferase I RfaG [Pseudazoarcus pumilus]